MKLLFLRGYVVDLKVNDDKAFVFADSGSKVNTGVNVATRLNEGYPDSAGVDEKNPTDYWLYNKIGKMVTGQHTFWPRLGEPQDVWRELVDTDVSLMGHIPLEADMWAARVVASLPRPIILFQGKGNSFASRKNFAEELYRPMYRSILDATDGSVILLDWDNRIPGIASYRVRSVAEWGLPTTVQLAALIARSQCVVGVDSGVTHFSRMTNTPVVGLWHEAPCYPSVFSLPSPKQVNIVRSGVYSGSTDRIRADYNIISDPADKGLTPSIIGATVKDVVTRPDYLLPRGTDGWLRWVVAQLNLGGEDIPGLKGNQDRHKSFSYLLRRFKGLEPKIIETGCARQYMDTGAGMSTYIFGAYVSIGGGSLVSIDNDSEHVDFARKMTEGMRGVGIHVKDGVQGIMDTPGTFDIAYLDSLDSDMEGHAEHTLAEATAVEPKMNPGGVIAIDDAPYNGGWMGKGTIAVPWLLDHGWSIAFSGYTTILERA